MTSSTYDVCDEIMRMCDLQERILREFIKCYRVEKSMDLIWLPRHGEIQVGGIVWSWRRHGLGVRFVSAEGRVVDVHSDPVDVSRIDVWRILSWMEGRRRVVSHEIVGEALAELETRGVIEHTADDVWRRLSLSETGVPSDNEGA